jgi:hypothetical protein
MTDLRDTLERESATFELPAGALGRMFERRRVRRRRNRVTTVLVALAIGLTPPLVLKSFNDRSQGGTVPGNGTVTPSAPASPLEGTWQTAPLTEGDIVRSFVAAGGSAGEGRAFFAQLGGGATTSAVITLRFDNGVFLEFESGDGNAPIQGFDASYDVTGGALTIASPRCTGTYGYEAQGSQLRLRLIDQCARHDGVYNTTLFTSFDFTKQEG